MKRRRFRVPREGKRQQTPASSYVARAWPEATDGQIRALFEAGAIKADGILVVDRERPLAPESVVDIEFEARGEETFGFPDVEVLLWGDQWVIVDKPIGVPGRLTEGDPMDPVKFMADALGMDRQTVRPVWNMPAGAGGPWLIAKSPEVGNQLADEIGAGDLQTTWTALIERPTHPQGRWKTEFGDLDYALTRTEEGLAEAQLTPTWSDEKLEDKSLFWHLMAMCGEAGFPVLGDAHHGGYLVAGGIRLRLAALYGTDEFAHSWPAPGDWWPDEPVVPEPKPEHTVDGKEGEEGETGATEPEKYRQIGELKVSNKSVARIQNEGHPWVLRDRQTGSVASFKPGDPVELIGPIEASGVYALIDGTGPIVARVWSRDEYAASRLGEETEIRLDEAIGRRRAHFRNMGESDYFRVVHGEADGFPGLHIDRLGPCWRVITTGHCARQIRQWIYNLLDDRDPSTMIVEIECIDKNQGRRGQAQSTRVIQWGSSFTAADNELIIRDLGIRYAVYPVSGAEIGLRADQRDNRQRALERAKAGETWLNLFCHSGAFALTLAKEGVESISVTTSKASRQRAEKNRDLNAISPDLCKIVDGDPSAYLEDYVADEKPPFHGIIFDPPQGPQIEDEAFQQLLQAALSILRPDGAMLVCRRGQQSPQELQDSLQQAASEADCTIDDVEEAPPSSDFPQIAEFPEGAPFAGLWIHRRS